MAKKWSDFPVGTIAGPNYEAPAFVGIPDNVPRGWVLCIGQTIPPEEHEVPKKKGQPLRVPDLRRSFTTGTATHIDSWMDDDGKIGKVDDRYGQVPGVYAIMRIK